MAGLSVIRHRWNAVFTREPPVAFKLETNGFQLDNIYPGAKRRVLAPRTYVPPLGREFVDSDGELCF